MASTQRHHCNLVEVVFLFFLYISHYKADPRLGTAPVDLTLAALLFSVVTVFFAIIRGQVRASREAWLTVAFISLFIVWCTTSMLWAPAAGAYASTKLLSAWALPWCVAVPALLSASSPQRQKRLLWGMALLGSAMGLDALLYQPSAASKFVGTAGASYLAVGRVVGLAACIVLATAIATAHRREIPTWLGMLWVGALLLGMVIFGARGPLVALVVAATMLLAWGTVVRANGHVLISPIVVLTVMGAVIAVAVITSLWLAGWQMTTLDRLSLFFQENKGGSVNTRLGYLRTALSAIIESPIWGHGFAAWPWLHHFGVDRSYPHNIFLEVWVETGAVGLILLIFALATGIGRLGSLALARRDPVRLVCWLAFLYTWINTLFSGDVNDNRMAFVFLGFAAGLPSSHSSRAL